MKLRRALRHLFATHWSTRRRFTAKVLGDIEATISQVESQHAGEIRFVVETALHPGALWRDVTPRQRALEVFAHLGVWDTQHNNGVLIYVLLADRAVEILADRGLAAQVAPGEWEQICREMERIITATATSAAAQSPAYSMSGASWSAIFRAAAARAATSCRTSRCCCSRARADVIIESMNSTSHPLPRIAVAMLLLRALPPARSCTRAGAAIPRARRQPPPVLPAEAPLPRGHRALRAATR
jgi:hypothetical protein